MAEEDKEREKVYKKNSHTGCVTANWTLSQTVIWFNMNYLYESEWAFCLFQTRGSRNLIFFQNVSFRKIYYWSR